MLRRRAADARVQTYLGRLLTSDEAAKEVRRFGFERYLLERWRDDYLRFRAEFEVVEGLRAQARDRIPIIVSHRFSTVRTADRIAVVESWCSRRARFASPDRTHASLYQLQARGYQDDELPPRHGSPDC